MSGLKLKISQVRNIAENEIQEPMADQLTTESVRFMCFCWDLFTFNKYLVFLVSLVICIHVPISMLRMEFERSLRWCMEQFVFYVTLLVQYRCHVFVSLI